MMKPPALNHEEADIELARQRACAIQISRVEGVFFNHIENRYEASGYIVTAPGGLILWKRMAGGRSCGPFWSRAEDCHKNAGEGYSWEPAIYHGARAGEYAIEVGMGAKWWEAQA